MGLISDYVRAVMQKDQITGNELLRLNMNHVMREMNVTPNQLAKSVKKEKKKHR